MEPIQQSSLGPILDAYYLGVRTLYLDFPVRYQEKPTIT